jgi:hypothetical protein
MRAIDVATAQKNQTRDPAGKSLDEPLSIGLCVTDTVDHHFGMKITEPISVRGQIFFLAENFGRTIQPC